MGLFVGHRLDLLKFPAILDKPAILVRRSSDGGLMKQIWTITLVFLILMVAGCSGGSLTTREKGAGIGALGGAAAGGAIGAAVGHPGVGAAVGGAFGSGAGALIGDQLQGQEIKQADQQRQIDLNQAELTDKEGTSKD